MVQEKNFEIVVGEDRVYINKLSNNKYEFIVYDESKGKEVYINLDVSHLISLVSWASDEIKQHNENNIKNDLQETIKPIDDFIPRSAEEITEATIDASYVDGKKLQYSQSLYQLADRVYPGFNEESSDSQTKIINSMTEVIFDVEANLRDQGLLQYKSNKLVNSVDKFMTDKEIEKYLNIDVDSLKHLEQLKSAILCHGFQYPKLQLGDLISLVENVQTRYKEMIQIAKYYEDEKGNGQS